MKESYWGYWLIILGIFILVVMMFTQAQTTSNTQDFYQLKEISEAAMYDAIDYGYARGRGGFKISREKFIESFLQRFAESVTLSNAYTINFYDIYESPPKVSIEVISRGGSFFIAGENNDVGTVNRISVILEESDICKDIK